MIKGIEFNKNVNYHKDVAIQLAEFCNKYHITRDKIIAIEYNKANDGTCYAAAMLLYEDKD